jgi:hypothetical protein
MVYKKFSFWILLGLFPWGSFAQKVTVKSFLQADTVLIGEPVVYSIVCQYSENLELVLPNKFYTTPQFKAFSKVFYPTITKNKISTDSIVYTIKTFETKPFIDVKIPVFILENGKKILVPTQSKRLYIKTRFPEKPNLKDLDRRFSLVPMRPEINYLKVLGVIVGLLVLAVLFWRLFGKKIQTFIVNYLLIRKHAEFLADYNKLISIGKKEQIQKAFLLWRNYVASISKINLDTMTSSEMAQSLNREGLGDALATIDKALYSNEMPEGIGGTLLLLRDLATTLATEKRFEISERI